MIHLLFFICGAAQAFQVRPVPLTARRTVNYNGITLNEPWPPHYNVTQVIGDPLPTNPYIRPIAPRVPPYLKTPPALVNATLGRQLFVDTFLIQSARVQRNGSPAAWEPVADLEDLIEFHTATVHPVSPLFPHEVERVHPWVDGTVWNGDRGVFEHFFACTDPSITCGAFIGWRTCMATSRDGVKFGRVRRVDLPTGDHPRDCRATRERGKVVRDPSEPDPGKRYKLGLFLAKRINDTEIGRARTPATRYHEFFSANGMRWEKGFEAGVVLDTSGMHFDPFRRVWAFSLKENFMYYIRTARYYEVASISYPFSWPNYLERCYSKVHELDQGHMFLKWKPCFAATGPSHASPESRLFLAADNADTPYNHESDYFNVSGATPGTYRDVPQEYRRVTDLYMFDATAYESLMVAFFSIHSAGDAYPKQIEPHVAFSRDGFHYSRVPRGRRSPFLDTARTNCEQFACNVDGITAGHELLFYCGATEIRPDRDLAANPIHMFADEGKTLVFRLRRDGFASLGLRDTVHKDHTSLEVTTRRLVLFKNSTMFLNINLSTGATLGIHDAHCLDNNNSIKLRGPINETRYSIDTSKMWCSKEIDNTVFRNAQLRFTFSPGTQLFSFWTSQGLTGESGGYLLEGKGMVTDSPNAQVSPWVGKG